MSEQQFVEVDLDKLRARMQQGPITEDQVDLLFALIEVSRDQAAKAETGQKAWTELGAQAQADAAALRVPAQLAANLLFNLDQQGGLGHDRHRVIKETQLALDSALHDTDTGAALLSELSAARAVVALVRRWTQHPTSALPIDKADMLVIGGIIEALDAYDDAMKVREM